MARMQVWETPFSDQRRITAQVEVGQGVGVSVRVVVSPSETAYVVNIEDLIGMRIENESVPDSTVSSGFPWEAQAKMGASAYELFDSDWLAKVNGPGSLAEAITGGAGLRHFVILGDDWIVEWISGGEPQITS